MSDPGSLSITAKSGNIRDNSRGYAVAPLADLTCSGYHLGHMHFLGTLGKQVE